MVGQGPGIVNKTELFSLVIIKTEFVHSNEVTPINHLPSSERFIAALNEKVCICVSILNSRVSRGFVLFAQSTYLYAF